MSLSDDADAETLISHLAGPLSPPDREAFRRAAEEALTRLPCQGEGVIYRVISALQREYFVPLDDHRARWDIANELGSLRRSRLANGPPIAYGGDLRHVRYRKPKLAVVG
jgi:hypothetical protein